MMISSEAPACWCVDLRGIWDRREQRTSFLTPAAADCSHLQGGATPSVRVAGRVDEGCAGN
jgi:hypothetical protein